jgi:uncharacterized protein YhbP (UPF0306 family)
VAATINQDWGKPGLVKGIQLQGQAQLVIQKGYEKKHSLFTTRYPWASEYPDHQLYQIIPTELYFIDHELFGHFYRVRII